VHTGHDPNGLSVLQDIVEEAEGTQSELNRKDGVVSADYLHHSKAASSALHIHLAT